MTTEATLDAAPAAPAPAAPESPAAAPSILGDDLKFAENWHAALGDDFAPHAGSLAKFKDLAGLAKSYIHAQTMGIKYPGEDADADSVIRFRQVAGVPNDPTLEAYGLTLPEDAGDDVKDLYGRITQAAHAAHVPPAALQKLVSTFEAIEGERLQQHTDAQAKAIETARNALVSEWRGDYEANSSKVRHITEKIADTTGVDVAALGDITNNPAFAKLMLGVAKLTSEDGIRPPANMGDLRSDMQRAEDIMAGKDAVWGEKYQRGSDEEKREAFKIVASLLDKARK